MGRTLLRGLLFTVILLVHAAILHAQAGGSGPGLVGSPPPPESSEWRSLQTQPIERVGEGRYRIGEVIIDKSAKSISFPASVNMDKGLLEYLLVRSGGKTHESLFRTKVEPYQIQIAMLLIGAEGTDRPMAFQGAPELPRGDKVTISVKLSSPNSKEHSFQPEEWIGIGSDPNEPLKNPGELYWIFTGSTVDNGMFRAQVEGSIIAIYHDPSAIFDNGSPGGETDKIWFAKEGTVPSPGTPVSMTIKLAK